MSQLFQWRLEIRESETLSSSARLVALTLSTWMDKDGICWPGIRTIAKSCAVCRDTVAKAIGELMTAGHLDVNKGGAGQVNHYRCRLLNHSDTRPTESDTRPTESDTPRSEKPSYPAGHPRGLSAKSVLPGRTELEESEIRKRKTNSSHNGKRPSPHPSQDHRPGELPEWSEERKKDLESLVAPEDR